MTIVTLLFALIALPANTEAAGAQPGRPIMLDFTASWCGPCRQMRPAVEQLVQKGYPIKAVDIDASPELAERYEVTGVPTFIVIDPSNGRALARSSGYQPAADLESLYRKGKDKLPAKTPPTARVENDSPDVASASENEVDETRPTTVDAPNPKPWETVVRIKVHGSGMIGFGSGTIVHSTSKESIILTCAHIFKLERGPQAPPSKFPRPITVDLFDGKLSGIKPAQVHYSNETFEGEAIDYDFSRDVGLIRIKAGRRLPFARVVPPHWKPAERMDMITVGCSEGHDATAWNTVIMNPNLRGLNGNGSYEAIECMVAPKQGRSGGGLFTSDGFVAGVCDFAEPRGNHGLYASPKSIYSILDRNSLTALYSPVRKAPDTLLAKNRPAPARSNAPRARGQSPDHDDADDVTMPPPEMLGIKAPVVSAASSGDVPSKRASWVPKPSASATNLVLDKLADPDHFDAGAPTEKDAPTERSAASKAEAGTPTGGRPWKTSRTPLPALSAAGLN